MKFSLAPPFSLAAFGLAFILSSASLAAAADTLDFPAGVACKFQLRIDSVGGPLVQKTFTDTSGNFVRQLAAGTGGKLTFTNVKTGATFTLPSNGSVQQITQVGNNFMDVATGHNILILFPTDVPAGPTTTLYVGRVVFTFDSAGNFTLLGSNGKSTDMCALLSS
jgi:hypothetical protein